MRRALLVLAAAGIVAVAIVAFAPATVVGEWIERASRGGVLLADAEGTLWHGRGTLVAGATHVPFAWSVDALPLARGELRVALSPFDASARTPRGRFALRGRTIAVRDLDVVLPAALATTATALHASGDAHFTSPSLDWAPEAALGSVQIEWRDARLGIAAGGGIDLGVVHAALTGDGAGLRGPVSNDGGDVAVRGNVGLQPDAFEASLLVSPRRTDDRAIVAILAALGAPEGGGYRIVLRRRRS
jgi:hypothetical protein